MGSGKGQSKRVSSVAAAKKPAKKKQSFPPLIAKGDLHVANEHNLLLIGPHGTGKTEELVNLADRNNLKLKYFSASTLDPYTDLVGVPIPKVDEHGEDYLKFVRDRSLMEAEIIFFDELNRAQEKTLDAVFEIIQFRTINGEPLPNLKACWAAMNPSDEGYNVEDLDPALYDRFDAYYMIEGKPDVRYMKEKMPEAVAQALIGWHNGHDASENPELYISPRRLTKLGQLWEATGSIKEGLPPFAKFDTKKLELDLRAASKTPEQKAKELAAKKAKMAAAGIVDTEPLAPGEFKYTKGFLQKNAQRIANQIQVDPDDSAALVGDILKTFKANTQNLSPKTVCDYVPFLRVLPPKDLEAIFAGRKSVFKANITDALRDEFPTLDKDDPDFIKRLKDAHVVKRTDADHWDRSDIPA